MRQQGTEVRLLGAVLSFLVPGVGQLIQGRPRVGAVLFLLAVLTYAVVFGVSMFISEYEVPLWVQASGVGWNVIAGVEALLHVRSAPEEVRPRSAPPGAGPS